jgi:ribonuclease HI
MNKLHKIYNSYTSHRSEAWGVYSTMKLIEFIKIFRKQHNNNNKLKITILCDNKAVVDTINKIRHMKPTCKDYYSADFDIIDEIRVLWKKLQGQQIELYINHIKGHQDRQNNKLSNDAKLNIEADKLATKSLSIKQQMKSPPALANASLEINNLLVTYKHKHILRKLYHSMQLREYMVEVNNWSDKDPDNIWWEVHEASIRGLSTAKRQFIQKFIHKKLACNYRQQKYYDYKPGLCMCCQTEVETQDHIFRCTSCPQRNKLKSG